MLTKLFAYRAIPRRGGGGVSGIPRFPESLTTIHKISLFGQKDLGQKPLRFTRNLLRFRLTPLNLVWNSIKFMGWVWPCRVPAQILFEIPSVFLFFPVRTTHFPWQTHSKNLGNYTTNIEISLIFRINHLAHKIPCFGKISRIPVFSQTGNFCCHFPCFPCAVGTLPWHNIYYCSLSPSLTLLRSMMITKLMRAAVTVVVILAFLRMMSSSAAYRRVTTIIRYMMTPKTAANTQHIYNGQVRTH